MAAGKTFTLNSGYKIPAVGFGTWQSKPNEVEEAVKVALKAGYRHIDCAAVYGNEQEVGRGIKASGVPREEIFITSKLWNTKHDPSEVEPALDKTLSDLGIEYLDLYLIHWPCAFAFSDTENQPKDDSGLIKLRDINYTDTWLEMEKMVKKGKTKSIGVSNFTISRVEEVLRVGTIPPAVNQIEAHPHFQQQELTDWHHSKNILIEAYSPLGNNIYNIPMIIEDERVKELAKKMNKDVGGLIINWAIQRGTIVLPKSVTPKRIESNLEEFEIPQDIFDELNKMDKKLRMNYPVEWGTDVFDEMGEDYCKKAAKDQAEGKEVKRPY